MCCTEYTNLCDISSCEEWIVTDIAEENPVVEYNATVKFNGVQLTPTQSYQGGFLAIKNTFVPNYTYELKVVNADETFIRCFRFNLIQNINL